MPATQDPEDAARAAGLRYVDDEEPGIARRRRGRGFSYVGPDGRRIGPGAARDRIEALAVPPGWTDVWICGDADGHLQATGRDDRGRKQHRYHDAWRNLRDEDKFDQLAAFGLALADIRAQVDIDLARRALPRERVLALAVRLLDDTSIRVGNPASADDESFGLTTLEARHATIGRARVVLDFPGKSGVEQVVEVDDPLTVAAIRSCARLGGDQLLSYRTPDGPVPIRAGDVNDHLRALGGPEISARDFRTWNGTVAAVGHLGPLPAPDDGSRADADLLDAIDVAARRLGNTREVCRAAYVHPLVAPAFDDGSLHEAWRRTRRSPRASRAERTTLRLLTPSGKAR